MVELFSSPEVWISLLTLTAMEIVLGIDNIVFITILCGRFPKDRQPLARRIGIGVALVSRLALLFAIGWVMELTGTWFTVPVIEHAVSGQETILFVGGVFLLGKASHEIYKNVEEPEVQHFNEPPAETSSGPVHHDDVEPGKAAKKDVATGMVAYAQVMVQVLFLDFVFSIDSVLTAIGMVDEISIMAIAMVIAVIVMVVFAGPIGDFVQETPSVRILALSFLILIGVMLIMEGAGEHVSKGYIYAAMGFALFVELINLRRRKKKRALQRETRDRDAG